MTMAAPTLEHLIRALYDFVPTTEELTVDTNFRHDLGFDSLDAVEVVMLVEDEYGIEIDDEDAESFATVGDLLKIVQKLTV